MNKKLMTVLLAGVALQGISAQAGLSEGQFKGEGLWKSASDRGAYEAGTTIQKNSIEGTYQLADGQKREWKFETVPTSGGFFKVKVYGALIGSGYCLEKVELCHYEIKVGDMSLEETLTVQENKLYRFGSKNEGADRIMWQESLSKK